MRLETTKDSHGNKWPMIQAGWKKTWQALLSVTLLILFSSPTFSYPTYEGCKDCHGGFKDDPYISNVDGETWGTDLMDAHEAFVSDNCDACHKSGPKTEVYLNFSSDSSFSKSCVGCHGRQEDVNGSCSSVSGGIEVECGSGAGLRQMHELNVGAGSCSSCHSGDPAPVGEDIVPFNYGKTGITIIDPCDADSSESKFGANGLDNDGDTFTDGSDLDCVPEPGSGLLQLTAMLVVAGLSRRRA